MNKVLNISIVLFNPDIEQITDLLDYLTNIEVVNKIYLIDNSKEQQGELKSLDIEYIFTGRNLGYGTAHNIALKKSIENNVKYHLVMNPDIVFKSVNILEQIISYLDSNSEVGLLMPKIEYPDGQTQYLCKLLPTPLDLIGRRFFPVEKLTRKKNENYELRFSGYDKIMQVPSLSGCFMLLRTSVLRDIGGFDERFFMYCEDLDLSRRVGEISATVYYPEVSVIHNYEKGSYKKAKLLYYHILSAIKYFNKWGWAFDSKRKQTNKATLRTLFPVTGDKG